MAGARGGVIKKSMKMKCLKMLKVGKKITQGADPRHSFKWSGKSTLSGGGADKSYKKKLGSGKGGPRRGEERKHPTGTGCVASSGNFQEVI